MTVTNWTEDDLDIGSTNIPGGLPDATALVKGVLKLAGDLGGTADLPTVPGLAGKYSPTNPPPAPVSPLSLISGAAGQIPLTLKGFAGQTAPLLDLRDSANLARAQFLPGGALQILDDSNYFGRTVSSSQWAGIPTLGIQPSAAARVGQIIRGVASQTGNLLEAQNSSGTVIAGINSGGRGFFGITAPYGVSPDTTLSVQVLATTERGIVIRGVTSQSANLFEAQDSAGTVLDNIDSSGRLGVGIAGPYGSAGNSANKGTISVSTLGSTGLGIIVRGSASQTSNLLEIQNSSGTELWSVDGVGRLRFNSNTDGNALGSFFGRILVTVNGNTKTIPLYN